MTAHILTWLLDISAVAESSALPWKARQPLLSFSQLDMKTTATAMLSLRPSVVTPPLGIVSNMSAVMLDATVSSTPA